MNSIVELIREKVILGPKPAVYISGGIDSTIVLHHLREKYDGDIYTYHATFNVRDHERDKARKISEHYNTIHKEVAVDNFVETLPEIMRFFERPRYNVWPYWTARQAITDGRETIYIGEGSDEFFGGYQDIGYLDAWANQITYVQYTYNTIHNYLGLRLEMPFNDLDRRSVIDYYSPPNKKKLRIAYRDVLGLTISGIAVTQVPDFITQVFTSLWITDVSKCFPDVVMPKTAEGIKNLLQLLVTKVWLVEHEKIL